MVPDVKLGQDSANNTSTALLVSAGGVLDTSESVTASGEKQDWHAVLPKLKLGGMALQLAEHCLLKSMGPGQVVLLLDREAGSLQNPRTEGQLAEALGHYLGEAVRLVLELADVQDETPEQRRLRVGRELQQQADASIEQDPFVRQLRERFGAVVVPGSIRPNVSPTND